MDIFCMCFGVCTRAWPCRCRHFSWLQTHEKIDFFKKSSAEHSFLLTYRRTFPSRYEIKFFSVATVFADFGGACGIRSKIHTYITWKWSQHCQLSNISLLNMLSNILRQYACAGILLDFCHFPHGIDFSPKLFLFTFLLYQHAREKIR